MSALLAGWLLTYLVHSTLLLAAAWLASRLASDRQLALRETLWRIALFGGLLTASLQVAIGGAPVAGSWSLAEAAIGSPPPALAPPSLEIPLGDPGKTPAPLGVLPPAPVSERLPDSWDLWLARGWALVGSALLALLAISYLRFRWRLRGRADLRTGDLPGFLRRLEAGAGTDRTRRRPVRLTRSARIGVPLARGVRRGEICLPAEALARLPLERQEIVVAHELAHLDRRDPLWFGLTRVLERALFFQPLNALARRRLQEISEFRCDDWAVAVTRRPISLAKCLTEVAEWSVGGRTALPVPGMAAGKSQLSRRVSRLLQRSYPMPSERSPRWLMPAALAVLALTVLIVPTISAHPHEDAAGNLEPAPPAAPMAPESAAAPASPATPKTSPRPPAPAAPALEATPAPPSSAPMPPLPPVLPSAPALADLEAAWLVPELAFAEPPELDLELAALVAELNVSIAAEVMPAIAELSAEIGPALAAGHAELAAELAAEWAERLEQDSEGLERLGELAEQLELDSERLERLAEVAERFEVDSEQVERLQEMAERLEERGYATEAEAARLAEMAERLAETARPSREQLERMRERARELSERQRQAIEAHRAKLVELEGSEREAMERAREEIRRSLEERRELIERARRERQESPGTLDREHRERIREELLRSRDELREQLRSLDEELERQDREEGARERQEPIRE